MGAHRTANNTIDEGSQPQSSLSSSLYPQHRWHRVCLHPPPPLLSPLPLLCHWRCRCCSSLQRRRVPGGWRLSRSFLSFPETLLSRCRLRLRRHIINYLNWTRGAVLVRNCQRSFASVLLLHRSLLLLPLLPLLLLRRRRRRFPQSRLHVHTVRVRAPGKMNDATSLTQRIRESPHYHHRGWRELFYIHISCWFKPSRYPWLLNLRANTLEEETSCAFGFECFINLEASSSLREREGSPNLSINWARL